MQPPRDPSQMFYDGIDDNTFLESCGVADLITTCFGGRNRKCADAFAKANKSKSLEEIEAELLGGQKLQGTLTAKEVRGTILKTRESSLLPQQPSPSLPARHALTLTPSRPM